MQQRIEALSERIQTLSLAQAHGQLKRQILFFAPGIGQVACAVCLADLPELGTLSDKKIARLVGVTPINLIRDQKPWKSSIASPILI